LIAFAVIAVGTLGVLAVNQFAPTPVRGLMNPGIVTGNPDCGRAEGSFVTPSSAELSPGQHFRAEFRYYNCGSTNWNGYRAVRVEGNVGPESVSIADWAPGTSGRIWIEGDAPLAPGQHRVVYEIRGARDAFADFTVFLVVGTR
jgi:hypothetical protein